MDVITVPCLRDNYAYILVCPESGVAAVVDPSEASPVLQELERRELRLVAIFNTHHHPDHVGGNRTLIDRYADLKVFAHASDRGRIPGQTEFIEEGDTVGFGAVQGRLTHNVGHTTGGVTYYFGDAAFTGDTLFAAGCGRLFEGTPEDMHRSLCEKIGGNPPDTKLYFGHEYTEKNLSFALTVEPDNQAAQTKLDQVRALRAKGEFTTPSTLADEWATNPFMRSQSAGIQATVRREDPGNAMTPASILGVIRALKDRY